MDFREYFTGSASAFGMCLSRIVWSGSYGEETEDRDSNYLYTYRARECKQPLLIIRGCAYNTNEALYNANGVLNWTPCCGEYRARTDDLLHAMQTL